MPWKAACVACEGEGCERCEGTGELVLRGCPFREVGEEVWEVLGAADAWGRGIPVVAGGWLDQPALTMEAIAYVERERAEAKAEAEERAMARLRHG